jgi:hypothetical protein
MFSYFRIVTGFFILFLIVPASVFPQQYSRRQLSGLYTGNSGGIPMRWYGDMEVIGTAPTNYYKLYIRTWGRFVLKEKDNHVSDVRRFLFIKKRPAKWMTLRGKWKVRGDSVYLNYRSRYIPGEAYQVQFYYDEKVLGFWKLYKFGLRGKKLSLMKILKGDE